MMTETWIPNFHIFSLVKQVNGYELLLGTKIFALLLKSKRSYEKITVVESFFQTLEFCKPK